MIKLAIFDLDGTLLNTINDLADSCNYILQKNNFPTHPVDSYKYFVGNGMSKVIERALPVDISINPDIVENLRKEFIEYYKIHSMCKTAPYTGVIDMLKTLYSMNIKLAVASNKFIEGTQMLVSQYFSEINFSSVLGQRTEVPIKPNPQIVYDIMNETEIKDKNEILYIGDTGIDMQTSKNAGVKGIGVLWGFRSKKELIENGAEYIIDKPEEIFELIR